MAVIDPATMQLPRTANGNPQTVQVINNIPPVTVNPAGAQPPPDEGWIFPRGVGIEL